MPRVAIIDSGVARTPELRPLIEAEYDLAGVPPRASFMPRYDHGTMVATVLARAAHSRVRIVSLRIDDPKGCPAGLSPPCQPRPEPVANAVRTAVALGVDAINMSLALPADPLITKAVKEAADRGIHIVLAAGNDGMDHPGNLDAARAAFPRAVLVGAVDDRGRVWVHTNRPQTGTPGYRYAWARGVSVATATAQGRATRATGTSFAVPIETARLLAG